MSVDGEHRAALGAHDAGPARRVPALVGPAAGRRRGGRRRAGDIWRADGDPGASRRHVVGRLAPIAPRAVEGGADAGRPSLGVHDPRTDLERRAVTDVLAVPTGQNGDPFAVLVGMERGDRPLHADRVAPP